MCEVTREWTTSLSDPVLRRWGHSVVLVNDKVVVFGGFGPSPVKEKHGRMGSVVEVSLEQPKVEIRTGFLPPREQHSACASQDHWVAVGGRTNPLNALSDVTNDRFLRLSKGRFRHTCHLWKDELIVYGGVDSNRHVLGDYNGPARASHASALVGDELYIYGGMSSLNEYADGFMRKYNLVTGQWSVLGKQGLQRYSHKMVFVPSRNALVVVGGMSEGGYAMWRRVHVFDLSTLEWTEVPLSMCETHKSEPLWLRHDIVLLPNEDILVLGGGGLCFSFGNYFSPSALISTKSWKLCQFPVIQEPVPVKTKPVPIVKQVPIETPHKCSVCSIGFASKNKRYQHAKATGHFKAI